LTFSGEPSTILLKQGLRIREKTYIKDEKPMMISEGMNTKLNEQIKAEFTAAYNYLGMACAFDKMGLRVLAKRFLAQHDEEHEHAMKILHYVQEVGGTVELGALPKPMVDYNSAEQVVQAALKAELDVTAMINNLVNLAESEKDHATRSFLQWFVDEQVEEVSSMTSLLDLIKLAGNNVLQVEAAVRHELAAKG
jgi:ferritin